MPQRDPWDARASSRYDPLQPDRDGALAGHADAPLRSVVASTSRLVHSPGSPQCGMDTTPRRTEGSATTTVRSSPWGEATTTSSRESMPRSARSSGCTKAGLDGPVPRRRGTSWPHELWRSQSRRLISRRGYRGSVAGRRRGSWPARPGAWGQRARGGRRCRGARAELVSRACRAPGRGDGAAPRPGGPGRRHRGAPTARRWWVADPSGSPPCASIGIGMPIRPPRSHGVPIAWARAQKSSHSSTTSKPGSRTGGANWPNGSGKRRSLPRVLSAFSTTAGSRPRSRPGGPWRSTGRRGTPAGRARYRARGRPLVIREGRPGGCHRRRRVLGSGRVPARGSRRPAPTTASARTSWRGRGRGAGDRRR